MISLTSLEQTFVGGGSNCTQGNIGSAFIDVLNVAGGAAALCGSILSVIPSTVYSTDLQRQQIKRAGITAGTLMALTEVVCYAFS